MAVVALLLVSVLLVVYWALASPLVVYCPNWTHSYYLIKVVFLVEYFIKSARNSCFLSLKLISCS